MVGGGSRGAVVMAASIASLPGWPVEVIGNTRGVVESTCENREHAALGEFGGFDEFQQHGGRRVSKWDRPLTEAMPNQEEVWQGAAVLNGVRWS